MPDTTQNLSPQQMHDAVNARDPAFDKRFVFGVITTGVYCRPTCPARSALPSNRRFFADGDAASAAGFRPCKRCRPDEPARDVARIAQIARYIDEHADNKLTLAGLAQHAGLSPSYLQKAFKKVIGVSPKAYQDAARIKQMKRSLRAGGKVTAAIFDAGYGSTSRAYASAARNVGMTPSAYRAGGAGETLAYACRDTHFGPLMMAGTARGVCFVMFGESEKALAGQLVAEFPKANCVPSPDASTVALDDWIEALDNHLSRSAPRPELPLDLRGTAFQVAVWQFLLSIPEGDVVSYGELAKGIDKPKAVRAAASACGANRIAVLVPCHRVLRGDGGVGGYRWGLERKRALLNAEKTVRVRR